jgi:RNA polymerase sigma-B factor
MQTVLDPPVLATASIHENPLDRRTATDNQLARLTDALFAQMSALPQDDPTRSDLREQVVRLHLPMARRLASRYRSSGEPLDDLRQVAAVGLVNAVDRYDRAYGGQFVAYAVATIVGELKRHLRDRCWDMHLPRRLQERAVLVRRAADELTQRRGRSPRTSDLVAHLHLTEEQVLEALDADRAYAVGSLNLAVRGMADGSTEVGDLLGGPDPDLGAVEDRMTVVPLLATLAARERRIVTLRFFGNMSQSQIAEIVGMSQMHVSRLLTRSLARLRVLLTER